MELWKNRLIQRLMENVHPAGSAAGRNPEESRPKSTDDAVFLIVRKVLDSSRRSRFQRERRIEDPAVVCGRSDDSPHQGAVSARRVWGNTPQACPREGGGRSDRLPASGGKAIRRRRTSAALRFYSGPSFDRLRTVSEIER